MIPACRTLELDADGLVFSGRGLWFGWSIDNTGGSDPVDVQFWDGLKGSSVLLGSVNVTNADTDNEFPNGAAVRCETGLFVTGASASCIVVPYFLTQTRLLDGLALYDDDTRGVDQWSLMRLLAWFAAHNIPFPQPTDVSPT